MFRKGHLGVNLFLASPVVSALLANGNVLLAGLFVVVVLVTEPLPDIDSTELIDIEHRGPMHSIVFAVFVGLLASVLGMGIGLITIAAIDPIEFAVISGFAGLYGVLFHLLADTLNPMGVRLLWPHVDRAYHFPLTDRLYDAGDPVANQMLLEIGRITFLTHLLALSIVHTA